MPLNDAGIWSGLLCGVLFGWVLESAGFGSPCKLTGQFKLNDWSVLKVMFTAIVVAGAAGLVLAAVAVPLIAQPLLNERDLRVRNHAGALSGFYLDALLGLVPVRAHRAEHSVRRQHESLLVEWSRSLRGTGTPS